MVAAITGDIVNSRDSHEQDWLKNLKTVLNIYGKTPKDWEVFRGDSFQLIVDAKDAIQVALHLKSSIKQQKSKDVRLAIGLGDIKFQNPKITESNGSAFVHSGECYETLKKQTLAFQSDYKALNETMTVMLNLLTLTADQWTPTVAHVIKTALENPNKTQADLASKLNKSQSSISETLKRGGFDEMMKMNLFYKNQISEL